MGKQSEIVIGKRVVDAAAPKEKRYDIWDADLPGFGLRVGTAGTKTYIVRYRSDGGGRAAPKRYVTIGRAGVLTVEQARKKAREVLAQALVGEDPAMQCNAKRLEIRMAELVDLYEEEGCFIQRGRRQGEPMQAIYIGAVAPSCSASAGPQAGAGHITGGYRKFRSRCR